jgi:methionine-rich copper-binding protein CopC
MKRRAEAASIVLSVALVAQAQAHPTLVRSDPVAGSKEKAPAAVALQFSENVQPVFNKIEVTDAKGRRYDNGKAALDAVDQSKLTVSLKPLEPGVYLVRWRAAGADSHPMQGSFRFEVIN